MREWWNWQTRQLEGLVLAIACRFKSCFPQSSLSYLTSSVRGDRPVAKAAKKSAPKAAPKSESAKAAKHEPTKILSTKAAAKRMNLSVHSVRIFIRTGVLRPSYVADRIYFFSEADCDWYNKNRRQPGRPKGSKMKKSK
jgi:hypothetical protein